MDFSLASIANELNHALSTSQCSALLIVALCGYVALKATTKVLQTAVTVIACLAVIHFVAPNFYADLLSLLHELLQITGRFFAR